MDNNGGQRHTQATFVFQGPKVLDDTRLMATLSKNRHASEDTSSSDSDSTDDELLDRVLVPSESSSANHVYDDDDDEWLTLVPPNTPADLLSHHRDVQFNLHSTNPPTTTITDSIDTTTVTLSTNDTAITEGGQITYTATLSKLPPVAVVMVVLTVEPLL